MTGGGGAFRLEEYRSSIQQQQQQGEEDKEVDDGFSDDDHDDCTDFTFSSSGELNEPTDVTQPSHRPSGIKDTLTENVKDEFLQQQEVRRRLKVLNNEFTNRTVPAVHPTKPGQRRVTFSENLVQYSTNTDQVPTTEEAQDDGDRVEEYEELSDTELDSSIYSDFDWTEDLLDSIPDSEEEEEEEETEKIEAEEKSGETEFKQNAEKTKEVPGEDMLYDGVIDELERMRLEEIDNETETDGDVDYTKTENTPNSIQFNYDHDMPTSQSFQIDEDQKSVLVEKEGEFKLVGANDVHAEESSASSSPNSSLSDAKVDPPIDPCHSNKQTTPKLRPRTSSTSSKDSNSSNSKPKLPNYQGNPRSRYGISPKEIKMKREKEKYELRKKQKESERQEEEKQQKEDEMEEAFKCWMMKKRQEKKEAKKKNKNYNFDDFLKVKRLLLEGKIHGRRGRGRPRTAWYHNLKEWTGMRYADCSRKAHNREEKKSPEGMANGDSEEAFKVWLDKKKEQKKRENYVERKRREELEDAYHVVKKKEFREKAGRNAVLGKIQKEKERHFIKFTSKDFDFEENHKSLFWAYYIVPPAPAQRRKDNVYDKFKDIRKFSRQFYNISRTFQGKRVRSQIQGQPNFQGLFKACANPGNGLTA
ncbi:hypothetical protein GQR58_007996 [Nymphon striatum]|nr:hypothetical protein GQR58_007996 [Nymphon striatum]